MAIIGESFEPWVKDQVNIRQEKLSLGDRNDDTLIYINNKTSFLRLTSGINVSREKCTELGFGNFDGNELAKFFTLFSSTFDNIQTSGIGYNLRSSYGFTSDPDYGLVPPPGLISANIKSLNRGSLREANINIVCHNLSQFKVLSTLFLKLRYSLLLEWGHTIYFDNKGILKSKFDIPNLSGDFINSSFNYGIDNNGNSLIGSDQESLLKAISLKKQESNGNYDAFFGVVKNFNWELQENGSYNITINAISTGDVIESLKVNTSFPLPPKTNASTNIPSSNNDSVKSSIYNKSTIHKILGDIQSRIGWNGGYLHGIKQEETDTALDTSTISFFTNYKYNFKREGDNQIVKQPNGDLTWNEGFRVFFQNLETNEDTGQPIEQYYIKLGTLLRIIESFVLYYDKTKTINNESNPPVFFIDHNYNTNYCLTTPLQISSDPKVCLIPLSYNSEIVSELTFPYTKINRIYTLYYDSSQQRWQFPPNAPVDTKYEALADLGDEVLNQEKIATGNFAQIIKTVAQSQEDELKQASQNYLSYIAGLANQPVAAPGGGDGLTNQVSSATSPILDGATIKISTVEFVDSKDSRVRYNVSVLNTQSQIGGDILFRDTNNPLIGAVMHTQLNINYIISVLGDIIDEDGNISIFDFLTNLMNGVKKSLGYINDFEIIYNESTNTYSIIDNALIPLLYKNLNKDNITKFNINLLKDQNNGGGSFVTNFGLKSELFAKIANTIALGAQANGNTGISNSTAFSEFNKGLIDRVLTDKSNSNSNNSLSVSVRDTFYDSFQYYIQYRAKLSDQSISSEDISFFESFIKDIYQYELGEYTQKNNIPGVGFIPLNLQLTMDGLSGMKIYETFDIDETLLPNEYQNRIRFIIRGVNHKIDGKGWETNIETLSIPKNTNIVNLPSANISISTSTTDVAKAEDLLKSGGCGSLSSSKLSVAEKILQEANKFGIKDKNRLTCLLTVAYAETKFTLKETENFNYRADRIGTGTSTNWNGDASIIFKDSLAKAGVDVPNDLEKILNNPSDSLANYVYANRGKNGGPSSKEGSKYIGRGITQTTFKSGYQVTQDTLKKYNINVDLISNPENIFQYEIPVLVIGKLEGLYGKKLSSGVDYINNATNVAQTQNGGKNSASDNYIAALKCINNNSKIQELISKYS
jgi:predicted chitinase